MRQAEEVAQRTLDDVVGASKETADDGVLGASLLVARNLCAVPFVCQRSRALGFAQPSSLCDATRERVGEQ